MRKVNLLQRLVILTIINCLANRNELWIGDQLQMIKGEVITESTITAIIEQYNIIKQYNSLMAIITSFFVALLNSNQIDSPTVLFDLEEEFTNSDYNSSFCLNAITSLYKIILEL